MMFRRLTVLAGVAAALGLAASPARASSHSDAPLIKQDPQANLTDVYAFIGRKYDNASVPVLNAVINVRPFSEPGDGAIYDRFADDALYSINIANPATGALLCRYDFRFSGVSPVTGMYKNLNTILSYGRGTAIGPIQDVGDARHNFTQTYSVTKVVTGGASTVLTTNKLTPPPNVGMKTTPFYNDATTGKAVSGATTFATLDKYTQQTVFTLPTGEATFAGPREDSFFSDIPGIFDLLNARILGPTNDGQAGTGVDGFKGYNVLTFGMQIPLTSLTSSGYTAAFTGATTGVGVYASVSRPRTVLRSATGDPQSGGPFVQVNRLGNPLFNEGLVALLDKDNYNRALPTADNAQFKTYALNPELAVLLNATFSKSFVTTGRTDLAGVFIPDVLRVDTTTGPVPSVPGVAGFNRLSAFGGDTTAGKASGWPNGRRFGDDVTDIALTAIANGPSYTPPILPLGDNVNSNDQVYNQVFPYAATPNSGTNNRKDP